MTPTSPSPPAAVEVIEIDLTGFEPDRRDALPALIEHQLRRRGRDDEAARLRLFAAAKPLAVAAPWDAGLAVAIALATEAPEEHLGGLASEVAAPRGPVLRLLRRLAAERPRALRTAPGTTLPDPLYRWLVETAREPGLTWTEPGEPAAEVARRDLWAPVGAFLDGLPTHGRQLRDFLTLTALCGGAAPGRLLLEALALDEDARDAVIDLIDDHLVEAGELAVLDDLEYRHPSFPRQAVYRFRDPAMVDAVLASLDGAAQRERATQLLEFLRPRLAPRSRGAVRLLHTLAAHVGAAEAEPHRLQLRCWIGPEDAEELTAGLAAEVAAGEAAPDVLLRAVESIWNLWPPFRGAAVLAALRGEGGEEGRLALLPLARRAAYHFLSAALGQQLGEIRQALADAERALALFAEAYGEASPQHASALDLVVSLYQAQRRYRDAEELCLLALAQCEREHGPEHPATAGRLHVLGSLYREQERFSEAEPILRRACAIHEQTLGADHPHTAVSLHNLAILLLQQGRTAEAEPYLARALAACDRAFGPDHPVTTAVASTLESLPQRL